MFKKTTEPALAVKYIDQHKQFIEDVLNGMNDWVRVLDREGNILYANDSMKTGLGKRLTGSKCYEALGRSAPCDLCIARKTVFSDVTQEKEEVINNRIYSVISSPVKNSTGEIVAVVETLRDISDAKAMQSKILEQNRKLNNDLDMARKLQFSMLPKAFSSNRLKFDFLYQPCENLGGDFLDIFEIDADHIGFYIADVAGHGVAASMLTVFLRSSIQRKLLSPAEVLQDLFTKYNEAGFDTETYITVFYAIFDLKNNTITYSNAGHGIPPLLFTGEECQPLIASGIPISNWISKPFYENYSVKIYSGDRLFFFTDGLAEIRNRENESFGENRTYEQIKTAGHVSSDLLIKTLFDKALSFAEINDPSQLSDDVTIAVLEVK